VSVGPAVAAEDPIDVAMRLALADRDRDGEGGGDARPPAPAKDVAVPAISGDDTLGGLDQVLSATGGDDQPASASGSGLPVPPANAAPAASGGAARSGGGTSAVAAPNIAAASAPATNATVDASAPGNSSSNNTDDTWLAGNSFLPGPAPTDGATSPPPAIAGAKVKALAATASSTSGLQSSGTRTSFAQVADPGAPGPYAISRQNYEYGYTALTFPNFPSATTSAPVELDGEVTYPTDLSGGPHPMIMILHGRHSTAYAPGSTSGFLQWPPAAGRLSIPSYQGYDYLSNVLASYGYVVVSIGANGINAADNSAADRGMLARAELVETQLNLWNTFDTKGGAPFSDPDLFVGKVDMQDIGLMGHSRGGEGVVEAYNYNLSVGAPYGIKAVFALAPVDFQRFTDNNVPFAVMLPYADGDVSDLQGIHYFDDEQFNVPGDQAPKYEFLVMGADHDLFNTVWTPGLFPAGAADDWSASTDPYAGTVPGNQRLTPAQQQGVAIAYMSAFFDVYLMGQSQYIPILTGDAAPPPSAQGGVVYATYQAPDNPADRLDVNRMADPSNLTVNTLGGAVTENGLTTYTMAGGAGPEPYLVLPNEAGARQPDSVASSLAPNTPGMSQLVVSWDDPSASYENDLPPGDRNVSGYAVLQFRAGVNFDDYRNSFATQDFSAVLTDGSGHSFETPVSPWTNWLFYPPGKISPLPKLILQGVRIPLSAFVGVDLTDVTSIQFKFDQRSQGGLVFSNIQFSS
jgi:hypothetical protein